MWIKLRATNFLTRFILILLFTAHLLDTGRALSDKRLCADVNCKEIISMGVGVINYPAGEEGMVSFQANSVIQIKSKGAGNNPLLWGIEVNGREGYAPKKFIRETKVLISEKNLKFLVDVKPTNLVPILTTSEKLVDEENTVETTTTKPLNLEPGKSTDSLLKIISNEQFTENTSPGTTSVLSEIVEGTSIPVFSNDSDGVVENMHENGDHTNTLVTKLETDIENARTDYDEKENEGQQTEKSLELKASDTKNVLNTNEEINVSVKDVIDKAKNVQNDNLKEEIESVLNVDNSFKKFDISDIIREPTKSIEVTDDGIQKYSKVKKNMVIEDEDLQKPTISNKGLDKETKIEILNNTEHISSEEHSADTQNILNIEPSEAKDLVNSSESRKRDAEADLFSENSQKDNIESKGEAAMQVDGTNIKVKNLDGAEGITKELSYNVTGSSNDNTIESYKVRQDLSANNETLDITVTKPEIDMSLNKKDVNDADMPVYQQEDRTEQSNTQIETDHKNAIKTDGLPLYKGELMKEQLNTMSSTSLTADRYKETPAENLLHTENKISSTPPKTPEKMYSKDEIIEENTHSRTHSTQNQNHISQAEINHKKVTSEIDDKTTNRDVLENSNTNIKEINSVEEMKNLNLIDNANNHQEVQVDQINNISYEQFKTDKQRDINNIKSLAEETTKMQFNKSILMKEPTSTEFDTSIKSDAKAEISNDALLHTDEVILNTTPQIPEQDLIQVEIPLENIDPTTYSSNEYGPLSTPLPVLYDYTYQDQSKTNIPLSDDYAQESDTSEESSKSFVDQTTVSYSSIPTIPSETVTPSLQKKDKQPKALSFSTPLPFDDRESKENKGLFATIMGTVNNMLSIDKKNKQNEYDAENELDRILFFKNNNGQIAEKNDENKLQYCKNIGPNGDCPEMEENHEHSTPHSHHTPTDLTIDSFLKSLASEILKISEELAVLVIVAAASLFFIFGYYCFCNSSREGALLSKLNQLESSLLASHKENAILKYNLMSTRQKLASIEDNSFGSNDMVVSLKKELEEELREKGRLQEQVTVLQKELENAADAGIELNKIVTELLSNQTGDESIISSVEELQKQLNEQQNTILEINANLAEKSRENSELQLLIAEQNARYETELANVQRDNDELEHEKGNLLTRLDEMKIEFDKDITMALEGKNLEIKRLQNEIVELANKVENEHTKWQTSVAKIEALEECLKNIRKDPHVNIAAVIDVVNVKAQLIETQKKYKSLKEKLDIELDSKKLTENQLEVVTAEVEKLKQDFNQSEKDKLEAQTRLEVLSNYFKDKENQLQKELSLKEAMWLKQQGETTTTVDRVTAMKEEIQSLKSQNDSLRAEIEAQVAAHKAQTGTLENRAHETWLAARQSDRRYEEARAEATALRRQLTALAVGNINDTTKPTAGPATLGDELTQAHSPIHMESPGSPMLGRLPPPPFLPPPFMGPPPPFLGMPPPPPFVPPGEMRPAPLGRIMSPPPQRSGRFSPQHLDYEDYLDYESNNSWHRHTYSPPPRTYRSLSPTDSRYNYGTERDLMSTYDTETDFSPPPSPRESRRRGGDSCERTDSNAKISYGKAKILNTSSKGPLSSGSEKSFNTTSPNDAKIKKVNAIGSGKTLV